MWPLTVLLAVFAGTCTAAPHGQPVSRVIQGISPHAAPIETQASTLTLPGFNHLALNRTQAGIKTSDDAAFEGTCMQVTLGGHGKVGMTTLEGRFKSIGG
ncbi:hypothetical protein TARUN_4180 [Trichoderma arundinaceum]|uniref:Uncharacterized protein n=1 Tax=Trichoderma arundinaceum TaxID=490622 RepID=A0A395NPN4_TRIAR|nr:hypothetical protein TARUN_4180 [Trichoderma arundinaceum]